MVAVAKPSFERFNPFLRDFVEMDPCGNIVIPSVIAGAISSLSEIPDSPKALLLGIWSTSFWFVVKEALEIVGHS